MTRTLRFAAVWAAANAIGGVIVGGLEGSLFQFLATLVLTGIVLGLIQGVVLRSRLHSLSWGGWAIASAVSWIVGSQIAIFSDGLTAPLISWLSGTAAMWEVFWLNLVKDPIILAVLGLGQWLVLRRQVAGAAWWVLISALGGAAYGAIASAMCALFCEPLCQAVPGPFCNVAATAMAYGAGWAAYGVVTGLGLGWLLRRQAGAFAGS